MNTEALFDPRTNTLTYVVWDEATRDAVVIDPVLDFEPAAVRLFEESISAIVDVLAREALRLRAILETHVHADHVSGADRLRARFGAPVVVGSAITEVQKTFATVFDLGPDFPTDGRQFDVLLDDGQTLPAGSIEVQAIHTPGHTPACVTYRIEDAVYTGDTMFMPDFGTGRCDFPAGSAAELFESVTQKLYTLPDQTRVFVGHDYQPNGRALAFETTIGACKRDNQHLNGQTSQAAFVDFRDARDAGLSPPGLLFPSVQLNIAAGALPPTGSGGRRFLKLPLGFFD